MYKKNVFFIAFLSSLYFYSSFFAMDFSNDLRQITQNVKLISAPGLPGRICVFGDKAFVVVVGNAGKDVFFPLVGAARYGKGRILVLGHDAYLDDHYDTNKEYDTHIFLKNIISWSAGGRENPTIAVIGDNNFKNRLAKINIKSTTDKLIGSQLLIANFHQIPESDIEKISSFIKEGGGFITAGTGWGWKTFYPKKKLQEDLIVNKILNLAGLAIADGYLYPNINKSFYVNNPVPLYTHSGISFNNLVEHTKGSAPFLENKELKQIKISIKHALESLPQNENSWVPKVLDFLNKNKISLSNL